MGPNCYLQAGAVTADTAAGIPTSVILLTLLRPPHQLPSSFEPRSNTALSLSLTEGSFTHLVLPSRMTLPWLSAAGNPNEGGSATVAQSQGLHRLPGGCFTLENQIDSLTWRPCCCHAPAFVRMAMQVAQLRGPTGC